MLLNFFTGVKFDSNMGFVITTLVFFLLQVPLKLPCAEFFWIVRGFFLNIPVPFALDFPCMLPHQNKCLNSSPCPHPKDRQPHLASLLVEAERTGGGVRRAFSGVLLQCQSYTTLAFLVWGDAAFLVILLWLLVSDEGDF